MATTATPRIRESAPADPAAGLEKIDSPSSALERLPEGVRDNPALDLGEINALYREVFEAQQVQRRLSGPRRVERGSFEIAAEIFPVQHFSGDFVSIFDQGESTLVALGDVAGKGLTAAMWSTHVMSLVRTYSASLFAPGLVVSAINQDLCTLGSGVPFTTMVLARLNWRRNQLTYSNAGHFPPFIKRQSGTVERISEGGPALGAIRSADFEERQVEFSPADMFVGYSDGLIECRNPDEEEFGIERLLAEVRHSHNQCASRALFSIIAAAQDFAQQTPQSDDLSLVIVAGATPR